MTPNIEVSSILNNLGVADARTYPSKESRLQEHLENAPRAKLREGVDIEARRVRFDGPRHENGGEEVRERERGELTGLPGCDR